MYVERELTWKLRTLCAIYLDLTLDGGLYYILHNGGRLVPAYKPEKHTAKF